MQDFRLLTVHIKFHQICTLIDSFCWKYIKIFAKKVQRIYPSLPWSLMQNLKKNWSVVSNMTRIWWILTRALKSPKNLHFHWFLLCKVFNVWPKKYRGVIFHDTEGWCKIWRKTDLWFGKWHEEYGKFSPEHLKVSKLGLWFTKELRIMTLKNDAKFEEELICHFKIDMGNLINFDPGTWKSQTFSL